MYTTPGQLSIVSPLDRLEGLRSPDQRLDVVGVYLEHRGGVLHGGVEVRQLFVAGRAVAEALDGQLALLVREAVEALGVLLNRVL